MALDWLAKSPKMMAKLGPNRKTVGLELSANEQGRVGKWVHETVSGRWRNNGWAS